MNDQSLEAGQSKERKNERTNEDEKMKSEERVGELDLDLRKHIRVGMVCLPNPRLKQEVGSVLESEASLEELFESGSLSSERVDDGGSFLDDGSFEL